MKKLSLLIIVTIIILLMIGCQDLFSGKPDLTGTLPEGYGAVRIILSQGAERTALPNGISDAFYFKYFFNDEEDEREAGNDGTFILPIGDNTLRVEAYLKNPGSAAFTGIAAEGYVTFTVNEGDTKSIPVLLSPKAEAGDGTFEYVLLNESSASSVEIYSFELFFLFGNENFVSPIHYPGYPPRYLPINTENRNSRASGYYLLQLAVKNEYGAYAYRTEVVHIYPGMTTKVTYTFVDKDFIPASIVTNTNNDGPGSLRYAIAAPMPAEGSRIIDVKLPAGSVIKLESEIRIAFNYGSIIINGNGVTITGNGKHRLFYNNNENDITFNRVHFKGGNATTGTNYHDGGVIINTGGTLTLVSCIFSGNMAEFGGAIYSNWADLIVKGCTFYNNTTYSYYAGANTMGGAIYFGTNSASNNNLTLIGNLFYENFAFTGQAVYSEATAPEVKYNVAYYYQESDALFNNDMNRVETFNNGELVFSPKTFRVIGERASLESNPTDLSDFNYPEKDFYGNSMQLGDFISGAVWAASITAGEYYYLDLDYALERGNVAVTATQGTYISSESIFIAGSTLRLTAAAKPGYEFLHWMENNEVEKGVAYVLEYEDLRDNISLKAVFVRVVEVTIFEGTGPGTFHRALTNLQDGDLIRFVGVTPGVTTVELNQPLLISNSVIIEGNGVTLTTGWPQENDNQMLFITGMPDVNINVKISRTHFYAARALDRGAAIFNAKNLILESCIFSNNYVTSNGGAIYNYSNIAQNIIGTLDIRGCTFYNNRAGNNGGAIFNNGIITLTGNIFFANDAVPGPVVFNDTNGIVYSYGYNVVDVSFGTGDQLSGFDYSTGDIQYVESLFINEVEGDFRVNQTLRELIHIDELYDFPANDFYGNPRNGAPGAVNYAE